VAVAGNGTFDKTVNWSASSGTISSAGMLSAPSVNSITSIVVTATSVQDSVTGTAAVSVTPLSTPPPAATGVGVSCPTAVFSGGTIQCAAIVVPSGAVQTVNWQAGKGTITATGLYTAPVVTSEIADTVTAIVASNPSITASFPINVVLPQGPVPTSVSLTCPSLVKSGAMAQCTAQVLPTGAPQDVTWSTNFGTITQMGLLTAPTVTSNTFITVSAAALTVNVVGSFQVVVQPLPVPLPTATGPVNLGPGMAPSTVIDSNGVIDVAWITQAGIQFSQSQDNGATFSAPTLALPSNPSGVISEQMNVQLDAANDIIIFATFDTDFEVPNAFLARSIDGGKTFSNVAVNQDGIFPVLLVESSGALDLAYLDVATNDLHESRSADGGKTFTGDQILWSPTVPEDAIDIKGVLGTQGQIFLTWDQEPTASPNICNVLVASSLDGTKFTKPLQLDDNTACAVNPIPLVDSAGNFNIAWNTNAVFFTRSTDQGQTFQPVSPVAQGINTNSPEFAVGPNGEIDLLYNSAVFAGPAYQVFFTQSLDHGATFSPPQNLSLPHPVLNFTGAGDAVVAVDVNNRITVAFEDDSNGTFSGDDDIYDRTSTDGVTFTDAANLSNTTDQSEVFPQILIASKGVRYFTWYDTFDSQNSNPVVSVFFDAVP
jgi:hypothetical protein